MPRRSIVLAAMAAAVVAAATFAHTVAFGFVWDDRALVLDDARLASISGLGHALATDFFATSDDATEYGYFRPVVTLTYALDRRIWGEQAAGFHLTNVAMHAAVCGLLYLFGIKAGLDRRATLLAAMVFAVHPVHVESVAWISGRTDVLAALLLLGFLLGCDATSSRARICAALSLTAALFAKEVAIVGPLVAWLCLPGFRRRSSVAYALAAVALWAALRLSIVPVHSSIGAPQGAAEHVLSGIAALPRYLRSFAWPLVEPSAYYQIPPTSSLLDPWFAFGIATVAATAGTCLAQPAAGRFLLAGFLALLPALNIVRVAAPEDMGFPVADRFLYLPTLFWALGTAQLAVAGAPMLGRAAILGATAAVLGLGALAVHRSLTWRDEITFFTHTQAQAPTSTLVAGEYAAALRRAGRDAEALERVSATVSALRARGEVIPTGLFTTLVNIRIQAGDLDHAEEMLSRRIGEGDAAAVLQHNLGVIEEDLGRTEAARQAFSAATRRRPDFVTAWMALGLLELRAADPTAASAALRRATSLDPRHAGAHHALALALAAGGDDDAARLAIARSIDLDDSSPAALLDAALLFEKTDPTRSRGLAVRAVRLVPDDARARAVLESLAP